MRLLPMFLAAIALAGGCDRMRTQPRYNPLAPSEVFADGASARPIPEGAVARGELQTGEQRYAAAARGDPSATFPFRITQEDMLRGRQRYNIYCSPCHGLSGDGDGMIVQRGFVPPPSLHIDRLRDAPNSHFYRVITNGWGAMFSYAARVPPDDRWRIAAYIRALQLSQRAPAGELSQEDLKKIQETRP